MEIENQNREAWLVAYLCGELEETERKEVERWLGENPEHEAFLMRLKKDVLFIEWAVKEQKVDVSRGKQLLLERMRRRKLRYLWLRVAAAVVLLLCGGIAYWMSDVEPGQMPLAQHESPILPGSQKAKLILSTGEEIDLTRNNGNIEEQDGSVLDLTKGNRLNYKNNDSLSSGKLIYNKIVVPRGGEFYLVLEDGTEVWLNAETELVYPVKFGEKRRDVRLKGEAYFKVKKDSSRFFTVTSGEYSLRVYGTEFNLNTYHEERIQAVLVQGSVGFRANRSVKEKRLRPNQLAVANAHTGEVEISEVDVYPYIAWKNQDMVLVNESLESIMEKVERWYDITVFFQDESLKQVKFYGNIKRYAKIEELLFFLEKVSDVRFSVKDRTLIISHK